MAAMAVYSSARRGFPHLHRQLLNRQNAVRCSGVFSIDDRRSISQNVPQWVLKIYESPPVIFAEETLANIHDVSGLPWWASIAVSTIVLRALVTFPLGVFSETNLAKLANLEPEAKEMNKTLKQEVVYAKHKFNLTETQAKRLYKINLNKQVKLMLIRNNCHPAKSFIVTLIQIPIWASISFALRDIAMAGAMGSFDYMSLTTEGFLWFQNLTRADMTLILPTMTAMLHLSNAELFHLRNAKSKSLLMKIFRYVSWFGCVMVIPIGLVIPSATSLYWLCSASAAFTQNLLLMSPKVRRLVRIPITAKEDPTPYATVWKNFRTRILRQET